MKAKIIGICSFFSCFSKRDWKPVLEILFLSFCSFTPFWGLTLWLFAHWTSPSLLNYFPGPLFTFYYEFDWAAL